MMISRVAIDTINLKILKHTKTMPIPRLILRKMIKSMALAKMRFLWGLAAVNRAEVLINA